MSGFSTDWLALREPADIAARASDVTAFAVDALHAGAPCRIVDLGCGTGSNVRYLAPRLPQAQSWRLVDHAAALLDEARRRLPFDVETHLADLREPDAALLAGCHLVTASALLDLVSDTWLTRFVELCREARAVVLVALNYDGRMQCTPEDPDDGFVRDAVNQHQRTDKGFGPALGPDAGPRVAARLREAGYEVCSSQSDWVLGAGQDELQYQLIAGWAAAATELYPAAAGRIAAWLNRRQAYIEAGISCLVVGHDDVAGRLR